MPSLGGEAAKAIARQVKYFRQLQRQLKEASGFPTHLTPSVIACPGRRTAASGPAYEAAQAGARWVCLQQVAQAVEPRLFPSEPPPRRR